MLYLRSINRFTLISLALLGLSVSSVNASTIIGGDLLDQAGANQLESWLGVGSQTFTNIFDGTTGAKSASWHSAVDGIGDTISIYDVTYGGTSYLIGGYRHAANTNSGGWTVDPLAFIFNLSDTTPFMLDQTPSVWSPSCCSVYDSPGYFATFGGGHDIWGGSTTLGNGGYVHGGYSYGAAASNRRGPIDILGLPATYKNVSIAGLETYTYASFAVPVPAAVWLFGTALIGLVGFGKRKSRIAA